MFAKYVYLPTSDATLKADMLADLLAIVTGTTDVNTLSATCDKANTTITADVAAGWTLHDAAAGPNARCVKAELADDPATFKYVVLDTNSTGTIFTKLYEAWDATGHSGTNLANLSATASTAQRNDYTNGGILYIFATARQLVMFSVTGSGGSTLGSSSNSGMSGCMERTRDVPLDTVAFGFPPFVFIDFGLSAWTANSVYTPRKFDRTGVPSLGTSAYMNLILVPFGLLTSVGSSLKGHTNKLVDENGQNVLPVYPLMVGELGSGSIAIPYGNLTTLCNVYVIPGSVLSNFEVIQLGGNYMALPAYSNGNFMFLMRMG